MNTSDDSRGQPEFWKVLNAFPDAVLITNQQGRIVFVHGQAEKLFGYPRDELLSMFLEALLPERFRRAHIERRGGYFSNPHIRPMGSGTDFYGLRKDGSEFPADVTLSPLIVEDEILVMSIVRDVTERKRAEDSLRVAEERYRRIFDNAVVGMFQSTPGGRFVIANPTLARTLGYCSPEELLASISDIEHQLYVKAERHAELLRLVREQGSATRFESQVFRKDGSIIWISENVRALLDAGSRLVGLEGTVVDITVRKEAEGLLMVRARQQETVAELSQIALARADLAAFMEELCTRLTEVLQVEFSKVLELLPDGKALLLRAGCGWQEALVGHATVSSGLESQAGYTLVSDQPVIVEDLRKEKRFSGPPLLHDHGVVSGMSAIIRGQEGPLGVVGVHTRQRRRFTPDDVHFLEAVANLLGTAIERRRTEKELRESEARYRSLVDNSPYGICQVTEQGDFLTVNTALVEMLGYGSKEELLGVNVAAGIFRNPRDATELAEKCRRELRLVGFEAEWKRKDGRVITVRLTCRAWRSKTGQIAGCEVLAEDVTSRKQLEQQLRQSQKMEAVGRLAGGVAHDFNNLLGIIIGYSQLLAEGLGSENPLNSRTQSILKASQRAAELTRQLLAFSRRQILELRVLDLNRIVADVEKLIRRLIGEDIQVVTVLGAGLGAVRADPGQMEQVLMNLAVNARDAMPTGGTLKITTANAELDEAAVRQYPYLVQPGPYVQLEVADTGHGMDKETLSHIFEPFFTTKEVSKGTGLGLATVYGIVKQSGGYIWVKSETGVGTAFTVCLPRVEAPVDQDRREPAMPKSSRGSETILLAEDDESLRHLVAEMLTSSGYTVLEACGGDGAIQHFEQYHGPIELLVSDVVMPGRNVRDLLERIKECHPETRVLYMTGYLDSQITHRGVIDSGTNLIRKPFTREALTRKVREVLEAQRSDPVAGLRHVEFGGYTG